MADIETEPDPTADDKKSLDHSSASVINADVVSYGQGVDVAVDLVAGEHADASRPRATLTSSLILILESSRSNPFEAFS
jgi:hypothetical protein